MTGDGRDAGDDSASDGGFWTRGAPDHPASRALLRWVEAGSAATDGDGHDRTGVRAWGQLRIAVTVDGDGRRRYDLRHVDDADVPAAELASHEDPAAANEIVRFDDDGRYRPLKTAPTLPTGWVFPDLDAAGLVRTVDNVYPATIANWYREREGELDVTHWRAAADRQTGIYDLVDELSGRQVARLAASCCVDSQCRKRREWDESAEHPLDVPRGDGEFPCREPCSLVVAAAREIALAEREESERVELSLSPAEREQLARIVDAVADGEADEIRDGDLGDGANRLRARYLREKLAEGGTLPVGEPEKRDEE